MTQYQITLTDEIVHGLFKDDGAMAKLLEQVLNQVLEAEVTEVETAREMLRRVIDNFGSRAPRAMTILEEGFDDAVAVLNLPERYRKRLRTTNGVERLNEEVRRRERVIRIFPNVESAVRLLGACRLSDSRLPLDSVEGHITHTVYGKGLGDTVLRRVVTVAAILDWCDIYAKCRGELRLANVERGSGNG